jgi:hypothetical protein
MKQIINLLDNGFHIFLNVGFKLFGGFAILYELLDFKSDSFGLTNYGFAIALGISSVAFSWARNIATEYRIKYLHLNEIGMNALYACITFLMGSALKFAVMAKNNKYLASFLEDFSPYSFILKSFSFICFALAIWWFTEAITDLIRIIHMTRKRGWNEETEKADWEKYKT